MDISKLIERFFQLYGKGDVKAFFSPGRVNLIGEHIDYNGGYVLPCAIDLGTYGLVRKRDDNKIRLASENIGLKVEVDIDDLKYKKEDDWANYPKGVLYFMKKEGYRVLGMDILVWGNIPNGAGLSSSASLELLIGEMANNLFNHGSIPKMDLIKIAQRAENDFVGVKCGIMDQFAVAMGKENQAVLLNSYSLDFKHINMNIGKYKLVVMNTNKRRELSDSKYNERRRECEKALYILKNYTDIDNLCQLSVEEFKQLKKYIPDKIIKNRAYHVVHENQRVLRACEALEKGDILQLGQLFVDSHNSLKDLYEVTGIELDTIVEAALDQEACVGARMTGAGFGGCAIALVEDKSVEEFMDKVGNIYKKKIGYRPDFYLVGIGDGTRELS